MKSVENGDKTVFIREMTVADALRFSSIMAAQKEKTLLEIFLMGPVEDSIKEGENTLNISSCSYSFALKLFLLFYEENGSFFSQISTVESERLILPENQTLTLGQLYGSEM